MKTALFGGEGLFFATLTGPGHVWLQSLPFSRLADRISKAIPGVSGAGRREEGSVLACLGGLRQPRWTEIADRHGTSIHLHDEGAGQGPSPRPRRPQGHLAVVPARRQDRRARPATAPARARCCASWPAQDTEFLGEAFLGPGHAPSATCRRSRSSIRRRPSASNVEEGVAAIARAARRASTRSTRSSARTCRPTRWTRSSRSRARSRIGSTR